jgi:hypothetical protein
MAYRNEVSALKEGNKLVVRNCLKVKHPRTSNRLDKQASTINTITDPATFNRILCKVASICTAQM